MKYFAQDLYLPFNKSFRRDIISFPSSYLHDFIFYLKLKIN